MADNQKNKNQEEQESTFSLSDFLYKCLAQWKWFVISLVVVIGVAVLYLLRTPSVYTRTASVLIKEDSKGKSTSSDLGAFADLGLFQSSANVYNELITFQSPAVMTEVVRRLNLCVNYSAPGKYRRHVAYGSNLPVNIAMPDFPENESAAFTMEVRPDSSFVMSEFVRNGEDLGEKVVTGHLGAAVNTPIGGISVTPTAQYEGGEEYVLYISKAGLNRMVDGCSARLSAALSNDKSSVIDLTYKDTSPQRAVDVLNTLITVYNENWVNDKNQIAISTSMFINERLAVIERELGNVDEDISSYKSENLLPDVQAASNMYMVQSNETGTQIIALSNRLSITRYVRDYLANEENKTQLLPANSGIENATIEAQIAEYNKQLLQRNTLAANSSTENPLVVDMDQILALMHDAILSSVDNQILVLNEQIKSLQDTEEQMTSKIAASPTQAKYLLSVERQQKVKEALYLFLLQKREENELSQVFTAYNTRIITPPYGSPFPTSPSRMKILFVAFVLGLLIPVCVIFIIEAANTRIRGRKDLDGITMPFIGEVPLNGRKKRLRLLKKQSSEVSVVVGEGRRDIINEAFRVVRTNLEFMAGGDPGANVMVVTSFNPGSGKSFITLNLAVSLAIKGKRILVVDGDLRHGSASNLVNSPSPGLSDYLAGRTGDLDGIIVTDPDFENLDILPIGTIPPNPTELLFGERLSAAIDSLRSRYDYVMIDCPPVEMVADTQIIAQLADRTIFVVRAGLFERNMLPELERIYEEGKYKNMSLILNGTEGGSGHSYRYGYRYGYHYGYGSENYYGK